MAEERSALRRRRGKRRPGLAGRKDESDNQLRFGFGTEASARDRAEFSRRYACPLLESYGSSEGTCYIIHTPDTPDGALGVPQQGFVVEIVSASGEACPPARFDASGMMLNRDKAIGEIVSRGAGARFEGYYNNPGASQDRLRDGRPRLPRRVWLLLVRRAYGRLAPRGLREFRGRRCRATPQPLPRRDRRGCLSPTRPGHW